MSEHHTSSKSPSLDTAPPETCQLKLRTLNVEIPEETYWHVRKCATESRLSVKDYMAIFCEEALPYSPDELEGRPQEQTAP